MHIKKIMKSKGIIVSAVIIISMALVGVTYAMLNSRTLTAKNDFQSKGVNIGVVENNATHPLEDADNVVAFPMIKANQDVSKVVRIKNIDSTAYPTTDTVVRVRLVPILRYNTATKYAGQAAGMGIATKLTYDINTQFWEVVEEQGETYYYYKKVLKPNEESEPLFTKIKSSETLPKDTHLELQVLSEGIRADQMEKLGSPWSYNIMSNK